jgi:hypothetical protein
MSGRGVNDMEDPVQQEKIRRGPHAYDPIEGKHGAYVRRPYKHADYPKMMLQIPRPDRKAFDTELEHESAVREWQRLMDQSIVSNPAEEKAWLTAHPSAEQLLGPAAALEVPKSAKKAKSRTA